MAIHAGEVETLATCEHEWTENYGSFWVHTLESVEKIEHPAVTYQSTDSTFWTNIYEQGKYTMEKCEESGRYTYEVDDYYTVNHDAQFTTVQYPNLYKYTYVQPVYGTAQKVKYEKGVPTKVYVEPVYEWVEVPA